MAIEIQNAVTDRGPRGSKGARLVFLAIARAADEYGFCYKGVALLASEALCDEKTVRRTIDELERGGWLHARRRAIAGRESVYFVNLAKLMVPQYAGGSVRPPDKQRPKKPLHLALERAGRIRFAEARQPAAAQSVGGECEQQMRLTQAQVNGAGSASGAKPIGGQERPATMGGSEGVEVADPVLEPGRDSCNEDDRPGGEGTGSGLFLVKTAVDIAACEKPFLPEIPADIFDHSQRTFSAIPADIFAPPLMYLSINSEKNSTTPIPLPLFPTVETVQKQPHVQVLPDESKGKVREQATAGTTARAGRGERERPNLNLSLEHRRERREGRRWGELVREGTETGVATAAGRVMRVCGWTEPRTLRLIVTAMRAHLAADRASEVSGIELSLTSNWKLANSQAWAMRFAMSPRYFLADGRWANTKLWPWDEEKLKEQRRAGIGTRSG